MSIEWQLAFNPSPIPPGYRMSDNVNKQCSNCANMWNNRSQCTRHNYCEVKSYYICSDYSSIKES
jgi:hypothetical protein